MKIFLKFLSAVFFLSCAFTVSGCQKQILPQKNKYEISAEYFDNGLIAVDLTVDYHLRFSGQTEAVFNVLAKNHVNNSTSDFSVLGSLEIVKVSVSGKEADYGLDNCTLSVSIPKQKSESVTVNIKYCILLYEGILSESQQTVNLGGFIFLSAPYEDGRFLTYLPTEFGNSLSSDVADFKIKFALPSTYSVAASGKAKSCDLSADKTLYAYDAENVRDFGFTVSDKYCIDQQKWGYRSVIYCFFDDKETQKTVDLVLKCLNFYESLFGIYPYETFTLAKSQLKNRGSSYPCLATVSDSLSETDFYYTVAYEIARQWWYTVVGTDRMTGYYIENGLSAYSVYLFFDYYTEYGISSKNLHENAKNALDVINESDLLPKPKPLTEITDEKYYDAANCYLFNLLCEKEATIGRSKTVGALREFFEHGRFKRVKITDLTILNG